MTEPIQNETTNTPERKEEYAESDDHLPRVQIELDKLNYANESINNLELELEESKREYLQTMQNTEEQLSALEKKLGSCVANSKPYYDARIELNEAKEKYMKAKNRFETAQELYVAAKNMQMYAEENLENQSSQSYDRDTLTKMLDMAKIKVNDTELSKHSSDIEQIEAFKVYEEKRVQVEEMEKSLKKNIEKSRKYFELKANLYKELRFLFTKIEGLKSCLKEAKSTYQQSLRNLELISTEIHNQRQTLNSSTSQEQNTNGELKEKEYSKLVSNSTSTLSSSSSSVSLTNAPKALSPKMLEDEPEPELEDFDIYFKNDLERKEKKELELKNFSRSYTEKINSNSSLHMTDDEIENLKLDGKLRKYKQNLNKNNSYDSQPKSNSDEIILKVNLSSSSISLPNSPFQTGASSTTSINNNRPQFRIPSFLSSLTKK